MITLGLRNLGPGPGEGGGAGASGDMAGVRWAGGGRWPGCDGDEEDRCRLAVSLGAEMER